MLGLRIKLAREYKSKKTGKDYTQEELATDIGKVRNYISNLEQGINYPNAAILLEIAKACEVPFDFFQNGEVHEQCVDPSKLNKIEDFTLVTILGVIRAGEPMYAEQNIVAQMPIPDNQLNHGAEYFGLLVKGDSMNNSTITDGSYVIVRRQEEVENGEVAVVLVNGEDATVKIFYKTDTAVTLIPNSNNPEHKPRMIDLTKTEAKVLGKVIMTIKKL
jgi:repressor LexA